MAGTQADITIEGTANSFIRASHVAIKDQESSCF